MSPELVRLLAGWIARCLIRREARRLVAERAAKAAQAVAAEQPAAAND